MTKQRRLTKEFDEDAIRLVATGGRTQRLVAKGWGLGLLTLVRWLSGSRDRLAGTPGTVRQADMAADMAAELKRLCRENEILRQQRDRVKRETEAGYY